MRWLTLYPLYVFSEIAIIATDLAELLGSAIALNILFPKLPLWAGVLLTASDVIFILALGDPLRKRPVKVFELLIGVLVSAIYMAYRALLTVVGTHHSGVHVYHHIQGECRVGSSLLGICSVEDHLPIGGLVYL